MPTGAHHTRLHLRQHLKMHGVSQWYGMVWYIPSHTPYLAVRGIKGTHNIGVRVEQHVLVIPATNFNINYCLLSVRLELNYSVPACKT